jgi:murein L,D-transpeptidase YcbB/YkuD
VYSENEFHPIWVKMGGLNKKGEQFLEELEEVTYDGLEKENYLSKDQVLLLEKIKESKDLSTHASLDISISRSFLKLASDLNIGRIDPAKLNIEWKMDRKAPNIDFFEVLQGIADGEDLKESLDLLRPKNQKYNDLKALLEREITIQRENQERVPNFQGKIQKGDSHQAIPLIRQRLHLTGDLENFKQDGGETYDEELFQAVKRFQSRHGLIDDGIIGEDFFSSINYSHSDLISKLKINLERLRWLPDFTGSDNNQVIVNIPDYNLFYIQDGDTVFTSKVVVGKDYRQTPVFKSEMTYLVFSPTWTLPETILWEDAIPSIREDEEYLEKNHMQVLDFQEEEVDYKKIKWDQLEEEEDFPYLIRQSPGDENPLGRVKFMFPNDYYIYIHDSPAQDLFSQDERTFSSGCIRMDKPEEFAALLLGGVDGWDEEEILEAMDLEEEKKVELGEAQDVWILYLTIWSDEGTVQVREDIYGMDKKLAEALSLPITEDFL